MIYDLNDFKTSWSTRQNIKPIEIFSVFWIAAIAGRQINITFRNYLACKRYPLPGKAITYLLPK